MNRTIGVIISQHMIAPDIYSMVIETDIALLAKAGQFVMLYCHDKSKIMPRPISICMIDRKAMTVRLVYRIAGKGTEEFSTYAKGDKIDLLGPLGNGFPIDEINDSDKVLLLGGGIGIPPMIECAAALKRRGIKTIAVMGYRDSNIFLQDELEKLCTSYVASEDGSIGTKGNIIDVLNYKELKGDVVLSCGPHMMLRAVKRFAAMNGALCYISMEERMACGIGACLGCVCKTNKVDAHSNVNNKRVCIDGPVFLADDIDL